MPDANVSASSQHYADAAFSVARQNGEYDTWLAALDEAASLIQRPEAHVLTNPVVSAQDKWAAIQQILPTLPPMPANLIHILADRDRLDQLPIIAIAFRRLVYAEQGVVTAEVTTAVPLDADLEDIVVQRLTAYLRPSPRQVVVQSRVDPSLIGGVIARVGDTLIDDSIRGRLERLRQALAPA